jgi:hypothetical protein
LDPAWAQDPVAADDWITMNSGLIDNLTTAEAVLLALKEQLADQIEPGRRAGDEERMTTLVRGLDVMTLLVRDAGRRMQGCPPAQLDDAVQSLLEQIGRVNNVALHQH